MPAQSSLRRLPSAAVLVIVVGTLLLLGPAARSASAATPVPASDTAFLSLMNSLRSVRGLSPLALSPQLSDVARAWSVNMANTGTLAHNGNLRGQVSIEWSKLGENVGTGAQASQVFNALVASAPHLRNMTDPAYSMIGIGSVTDARGVLWTTHVFLQPYGGRAAPQPTTTAAPKAPAPAKAPAAPRPAPATTAAPRKPAPVTTTAAPVPTTAAPAPTTTAAPVPVVSASAVPEVSVAAPELPTALAASTRPGRPGTGLMVLGATLVALVALGGTSLVVKRYLVR